MLGWAKNKTLPRHLGSLGEAFQDSFEDRVPGANQVGCWKRCSTPSSIGCLGYIIMTYLEELSKRSPSNE